MESLFRMKLLKHLVSLPAAAEQARRSTPPPAVRTASSWSGNRQFHRFDIRVPVHIRCGDRLVAGASASMGMGGLFIPCRQPFAPNTRVALEITLERGLGTVPLQTIGKVAYKMDAGMGIRFTGLSHDAYVRLRNLLAFSVSHMGGDTVRL